MRSLVPIDLERGRGFLSVFIRRRYRDHPPGRGCGLVVDDHRLDEAGDFPGLAFVQGFDGRAVAKASIPNLAVPSVLLGMSSCCTERPISTYWSGVFSLIA